MQLEYVPLLSVQRDLYRLPRGFERFREYLRTMIDSQTGDLKLPLVGMNPMGKDHLAPFLDALTAEDADGAAARATEDARGHLVDETGSYKVSLVVSDDAKGGWTNRYTAEFECRFRQGAYYKRGFIAGVLWTSESYTRERVREETLLAIYRASYVQGRGDAQTLSEMIAQESYAMARAGSAAPTLDPEDLAYTRDVLGAYLGRTDYPTWIAALFGDQAARELGHEPLGLSPRAGLALALDGAKALAPRE